MTARLNLVGRTSGRLTVLEELDPDVLCQCTCGTVKLVHRGHFLDKRTRSCGCLQREIAARLCTTRVPHKNRGQNEAELS